MFVVDADGLQVGLDDRRADELHATTLELLGDLFGERRGRLRLTRASHDGFVVDVRPQPTREAAVLLLDREEGARVERDGFEFAAVTEEDRLIYKENEEHKKSKNYLCSESKQSLIHYLRNVGCLSMSQETNNVVGDSHFGLQGHNKQAEIFYNEIKK